MESEETCSQLRKQVQRTQNQTRLSFGNPALLMEDHIFDISSSPSATYELINEAKQEIKNLQAKALKVSK